MNTSTLSSHEPAAAHCYQIYRQSQNGCHVSHGPIIRTSEHAVALFLATSPAFEGGGLRLWDHNAQKLAASAAWRMETTRMGFSIGARVNAFHEPALALIAHQIAERDRIEQAIANETMVAV